jgi:putative addiction module killer protein
LCGPILRSGFSRLHRIGRVLSINRSNARSVGQTSATKTFSFAFSSSYVTTSHERNTRVHGFSSRSPFQQRFPALDARAAAQVIVALARLEQGNVSNVKGVGRGVLELRIDYGPGYRVYLGKDGARLVILLGGGTKKRQDRDIRTAQVRWTAYKAQQRQERYICH